ncbi:MAG: hypothetical protein IJD58_09845 [Lachnospiraceae bacterium]|nr:hypothetical protein [Lachnospiraceae bacterium]
MRKRLVTLCLTLGVCLMSTACGGDDSKSKETTSSVVTTEATEETSSEVAETTTKKAEADSSEETEATTEEITTEEPTTEPEKIYDVYVNGKGYDKGTTLNVKVFLKANDKEFTSCCPSFNIAYEGNTNPEDIAGFIEYVEKSSNELLVCNQGDGNYDNEYFSFWGYYDLLARWNNPDAPPLDITNGIEVFTAVITFNEPGKYNLSVTSGNGGEGLEELFSKYDNCFSIEIIE